MRTLVLGGSVFVGRRLVRALIEAGHDVTVLNRGRTPTDLPDGVHRLTADRTDAASMRQALAGTEWDAIYDVSGFVMAAGGSDIASLLGLVDGRVGRYVYVSSIMAYDQSQVGVFPWTEDLPSNPDGTASYGGFKAMAERSMRERHAATGFPVSIVRPAAIYGPDNNIYDMETPMFLRLLRGLPIIVPHSGLVAGSYGHVDDLCALMMVLPTCADAVGEVFNVTTDGVTVSRYIETLAAVVGVAPNIVPVPDALLGEVTVPVFGHLFGAPHHAVLSSEKVGRITGFVPRYRLANGHMHTYEWFMAQGFDRLDRPLVDPVWRATWDFGAEAALAARLEALGSRRSGSEWECRDTSPIARPSDGALWASVVQTLRDVVLPAVTDDFARITVVQLIGLAHYARTRDEDPTAPRAEAVAAALDTLTGCSLVSEHWQQHADRDPAAVLRAASDVLVACIALPDDDPDAVAIRAGLRPLLLAQLDADLAGNAVLM